MRIIVEGLRGARSHNLMQNLFNGGFKVSTHHSVSQH
jgi:hypothetical protein